MNKRIKTIILRIAIVIVTFFACCFLFVLIHSHRPEMKDFRRYIWIFKDPVKKNIDTFFWIGEIRNKDICYNYFLNKNFRVTIWEFKDLSNIDLNKVSFNQKINLDDVNFLFCEELNKNGDPVITVNVSSFFKNTMDINLDKYSKIGNIIKAPNYKGFYGTVNNMSLSENGKHIILFNYLSGHESILLLSYKGHNSFYLIIIDSPKPFDENIIKILNLS